MKSIIQSINSDKHLPFPLLIRKKDLLNWVDMEKYWLMNFMRKNGFPLLSGRNKSVCPFFPKAKTVSAPCFKTQHRYPINFALSLSAPYEPKIHYLGFPGQPYHSSRIEEYWYFIWELLDFQCINS